MTPARHQRASLFTCARRKSNDIFFPSKFLFHIILSLTCFSCFILISRPAGFSSAYVSAQTIQVNTNTEPQFPGTSTPIAPTTTTIITTSTVPAKSTPLSPPQTTTTITITTTAATTTISGLPVTVNSTENRQFPTTTTTTSTISNSIVNGPSGQSQPKSFKFTLIAGKFWKFIIKANSFTNHKEGELRLHKNVSSNNYIIDDDGWFQYNPQLQQLFAWPSLSTKPGTYYFVLLPSAVDVEADSESIVNVDVVANIVVELIRPLIQGTRSSDVDQLIDHKFTLDNLHRHSSFPVLLNQIVSVFDVVTRQNNNNSSNQQSSLVTTTTTSAPGTTLPTQQILATSSSVTPVAPPRTQKSSSKFSEFLLISSAYSADGESFSLTWSTNPSLANNTISSIGECRLTAINDTISKLSTLTTGHQVKEDKYVLNFPIDGPISDSQAITPIDRSNFVLRVNLSGPCQKEKILEELGITNNSNLTTAASVEIDEKDNSIPESPIVSTTAAETATATGSTIALNSSSTSPDAIPTTTTPGPSSTQANIQLESNATESVTTTEVLSTSTTSSKPDSTTAIIRLEESEIPTEFNSSNESVPTTSEGTVPENKINVFEEAQVVTTTTSNPSTHTSPASPSKHQPKSLIEFLDSTEAQSTTTMSTTTATLPGQAITTTTPGQTDPTSLPEAQPGHGNISLPVISAAPIGISNSTVETSLNDDLIGVLNDIMDYLVSVAVPISVIIGIVLLVSILIALCNLCIKKRKSRQFEVGDRFNSRYGSERKAFLKNSSKPVILDADQKSLSMGSTPKHQPFLKISGAEKNATNYVQMDTLSSNSDSRQQTNTGSATNYHKPDRDTEAGYT